MISPFFFIALFIDWSGLYHESTRKLFEECGNATPESKWVGAAAIPKGAETLSPIRGVYNLRRALRFHLVIRVDGTLGELLLRLEG